MTGGAIAMMVTAMVLLWGGAAYFLIKAYRNNTF